MNAQEKRLMVLLAALATGSVGCINNSNLNDIDKGLLRTRYRLESTVAEREQGAEAKIRNTASIVKGLAGKVEAELSEMGKNMNQEDSQYTQTQGSVKGTLYFVTESGDMFVAVGPQAGYSYTNNDGNTSTKIKREGTAGLEAYFRNERTGTQVLSSVRAVLPVEDDLKMSQGRSGKQTGVIGQMKVLQELGYQFYTVVNGKVKYVDQDIESVAGTSSKAKTSGGLSAGIYYVNNDHGFYVGAFGTYAFALSNTGSPDEQWKASLVGGYDLGRLLYPDRAAGNRPRVLFEVEPYAEFNRGWSGRNVEWGVQASLTLKTGDILDAIFGKGK